MGRQGLRCLVSTTAETDGSTLHRHGSLRDLRQSGFKAEEEEEVRDTGSPLLGCVGVAACVVFQWKPGFHRSSSVYLCVFWWYSHSALSG